MVRRLLVGLAAAIPAAACRGPAAGATGAAAVGHLVDSLTPLVENVTGLTFRTPPRWATRDREQLRRYLAAKVAEQLPPDRLANVRTTYGLLGLIPDTLDLYPLLVDLLTQQVLGFYDPDSLTLFVVEGGIAGEAGARITVAHELIHALQDQYLPLDSLLRDDRDNDRAMARQAILEGQANYASLRLLAPPEALDKAGFWELAAERGREEAAKTLVAPLIIRESVLFPYFDGARFFDWWSRSPLADTVPYGPRMPSSTEEVLHPARFLAGDVPLTVAFVDSTPDVRYQDDLGEFEIQVLRAVLLSHQRPTTDMPIGWGGDRYRLFASPAGPALVWFLAWDSARDADRFAAGTADLLVRHVRDTRPGYRAEAERLTVDGIPVVRMVLAPAAWDRWAALPEVVIGREPASVH